MNDKKCDACSYPMSRRAYINGLYLRGEALCMPCQAVSNTKKYPPKQAAMMNKMLIEHYGVTQQQIDIKAKLPYWHRKDNVERINNS